MSKERKPYTVGYGKTPKHTRFKPGQSGNRKGRPKKKAEAEKTPDLCGNIISELQTKIFVTENGKRTEITKQEATWLLSADVDRKKQFPGCFVPAHWVSALAFLVLSSYELRLRSRRYR